MEMKKYLLPQLITIWLGLILTLAFGGSAVWAEEKLAVTEVYEEEAVVVTATRTKQEESKAPGQTEVITKEEIEASGAATVAEVLVSKGIVTYNTGGASAQVNVQLDGAKPEQTLVLINGVPANAGTGGTVDLSYFPTAGIERIEIAHGPLSALYGANALGGVLNIITDLTGEVANQATLTGGSDTYGQLDFTVKQPQYGLAIGGLTTDGYRTNSATKNCYLMGQYDFWRTEQKALRLDLLYNTKDYESPGSTTNTSTDDGTKDNLAVDLMGKNVLNQLTVEYKLYAQKYDYDYNSSSITHYKTNIYGSDLAASYQIATHQLLSGLQLQQEQLSRNAIDNTWHTGALFLQDNWKINSQWQLVSGVRWDTGSVYSSPVCPRIGLNYAVTDQFTVKLGYGKAFRAPTFDDLYFPEEYGCKGNPDLKPETSNRYDIIGEWRGGAQTISLNYFTSKVINGISWSGTDDDGNCIPINIDKMQVNGVGLSWRNQLNQYLSTGLKYTWTDRQAWDGSSYSQEQNKYGKNCYKIDLEYSRSAWCSTLVWQFVHDRCYYSYGTKIVMDDYNVLNLNIKYKVNAKLNYGLTVNNLTDQVYEIEKGYPMPDRKFYLSANYTF
jgi:outer membrane cobalamin receptor